MELRYRVISKRRLLRVWLTPTKTMSSSWSAEEPSILLMAHSNPCGPVQLTSAIIREPVFTRRIPAIEKQNLFSTALSARESNTPGSCDRALRISAIHRGYEQRTTHLLLKIRPSHAMVFFNHRHVPPPDPDACMYLPSSKDGLLRIAICVQKHCVENPRVVLHR